MDIVKIKGVRNGVRVILSNAAPFEELFAVFSERLSQSAAFFANASELNVVFEGGILNHEQKCRLQKAVLDILGYNALIAFENPIAQTDTKEIDNAPSKFHTGTLRSGQNVSSQGHLIVFGDVNPGAEVSAKGNVVVLGALRGIVHAGTEGDKNASVVALSLTPTQIRIANIITRAPDGEQSSTYDPEIAYIKDGIIYIDPILKKK